MGKIFAALITVWLGLQGIVCAGSMLGGTLSGYITYTDKKSKKCVYVERATITAVCGVVNETAYSLKNGYYFIAVPMEGDYKVKVTKSGFAPTGAIIHISLGKTKNFTLSKPYPIRY